MILTVLIASIVLVSVMYHSQLSSTSRLAYSSTVWTRFNKLDYIRNRDFIRHDCRNITRIG